MSVTHTSGTARLKPLTLRSNFAWTTCGSVVYSLCSWLMLSVIAKLGSPAIVGEFALGLAVAQPVMVFSQLSLNQAQATDALGEYRFGDYLGLRLITNLGAMMLLTALAVAGGYSREAGVVVVLAGVGLAFDGVGDIICGLLRRHERMDRVAVSQAATGVLSLLLLSGGLFYLHSIVWAAAGSALASALVVIIYDIPNAMLVLNSLGEGQSAFLPGLHLPKPHGDLRVLGRLVWTAMPLGAIMVLLSVNNNLSRYFVAHSLGLRELGIFSALVSFVTVGRLVTTALGLSASPRMARYYAARDRQAFVGLQRRLLLLGVIVGAAAPAVAAVVGRPLLTFFYTPEYARHLDVFILYLAAGGLSYVDGSIGWAITAARAFKAQAISLAMLTLVIAGSSAWLIPRYGLRGAAWAAVVAAVAQLIINSVILKHVLRALPQNGVQRNGVEQNSIKKPAEPGLSAQAARDFRRYRSEGTRLGLHVLLFCPGYRATLTYRLLHRVQQHTRVERGSKFARLLLNQFCHAVSETTALTTRILLPPSCRIGSGLFIPHFGPVTVHPSAVIGENCTLHQGVVIGQAGRGERKGVPVLGDRVYVGANAVVIGGITLGDDAAVGAGAVVTKSVPRRAVVAGNPARILSYAGSFDLIYYDGMDSDPQRLVPPAADTDKELSA